MTDARYHRHNLIDWFSQEALAKIKKYFEDIPQQPAPPVVDMAEPTQTTERRISGLRSSSVPLLISSSDLNLHSNRSRSTSSSMSGGNVGSPPVMTGRKSMELFRHARVCATCSEMSCRMTT